MLLKLKTSAILHCENIYLITMLLKIKLIFLVSCMNEIFIISKSEDLFKLSVIHVNDIHARFEETSPTSTRCIGNKCIGGISRLYTAILQLQEEQENSIVLNAGDSFQGTLWYNVFGWNVTQYFLNKLPCDAYTLGNHEFDDYIQGVVPFIRALNCPVIVANMDASSEPDIQGLYQSSTVVIRNGTNIGIIGAILSSTNKISNTENLKFTDEIMAVNLEAERLTKESNCSIIIVLSHCGIEVDKKIAREAGPHIGLIVGGHSHTFLYSGDKLPGPDKPEGPYPVIIKNKYGRNVLIVQASFNTKYLGNITVWYDSEGNVKKFEGTPIYLDHHIPQDQEINEELYEWKKEIDKVGNTILGTSKVLLDRTTRRSGESNLGSFLTDAMVNYYVNNADETSWTYASIAIINSGALRTSIDPGNITVYDIVNCHPFENTIDVVELTGMIVKDLLEFSVTPSVVRNGQLHEFLQISGIRVTFNLSKPTGSRVTNLKLLCNECLVPVYSDVNYSQVYRVIIPSFLVNGGDGYKIIRDHIKNRTIGPRALDVFSDFVRKRSPVVYGSDERISIKGTILLNNDTHVNKSSSIQMPVILFIALYSFSIYVC